MSSDRELLELAAKAAGLSLATWDDRWECLYYPFSSVLTNSHHWNPLTDDGDALRLAVKLRIDIPWQLVAVGSTESDELALIRRAIVRAAAEIAKQGGA
jgi:hypothetical protein